MKKSILFLVMVCLLIMLVGCTKKEVLQIEGLDNFGKEGTLLLERFSDKKNTNLITKTKVTYDEMGKIIKVIDSHFYNNEIELKINYDFIKESNTYDEIELLDNSYNCIIDAKLENSYFNSWPLKNYYENEDKNLNQLIDMLNEDLKAHKEYAKISFTN